MNARDVIIAAHRAGVHINLVKGVVTVDGPETVLTDEALAWLRAQKDELRTMLAIMRDEAEERAAILEFECDWPRDAAERCAVREVYWGES